MIVEEFYQNIYHDLFFKWIILNSKQYQKDNIKCTIEEETKEYKSIVFLIANTKGKVTIWYNNIVEEEIYNLNSQDLLFYLHYTIIDLAQCRHLFYDFYHTMIKHNQQSSVKIALCCNDGLSTSDFVNQMKEVCQLESVNFELYSLSLEETFTDFIKYDALYLAPQIAYIEPELIAKTQRKIPIYKLDPSDFATKDYLHIIKTIQKNLMKDKKAIK